MFQFQVNRIGCRIHLDTVPEEIYLNLQPSVWPDGLTERKREIVRLVGQELSNKAIADRLCISDSTGHIITSIFNKIDVRNRQKLLIHVHHSRSSKI